MTTIRPRARRRVLPGLLLIALCLLTLPAPALAAGNARVSGGTLIYDGGGEANSVTLAWDGTDYTLTDWGAGSVGDGAGCTAQSSAAGPMPIVDCDGSAIDAILIRTAGGDDTAQVAVDTRLPAGVRLTVELGDGADSWNGSRWTADRVNGGGGNDAIDGFGGADILRGGGGRDTVTGGAGNDSLFGGTGPDNLSGDAGNDKVYGDDGSDKVYGNPGRDKVYGGADNDLVSGGLGADLISGGGGRDRLLDDHRGQARAFRSSDVLIGGAGTDTADYSYRLGEATKLWLSLDRRANDGANGEDDQIGPDGSVENIIGGIRADVIVGSGAANVLSGREGADLIKGRGRDDRLHGDAGNDGLSGGAGDDELEGWWGEDTIVGGSGVDFLQGGVDDDLLIAEDKSRDTASCGGGRDRALVDSRDRVTRLCERIVIS